MLISPVVDPSATMLICYQHTSKLGLLGRWCRPSRKDSPKDMMQSLYHVNPLPQSFPIHCSRANRSQASRGFSRYPNGKKVIRPGPTILYLLPYRMASDNQYLGGRVARDTYDDAMVAPSAVWQLIREKAYEKP